MSQLSAAMEERRGQVTNSSEQPEEGSTPASPKDVGVEKPIGTEEMNRIKRAPTPP